MGSSFGLRRLLPLVTVSSLVANVMQYRAYNGMWVQRWEERAAARKEAGELRQALASCRIAADREGKAAAPPAQDGQASERDSGGSERIVAVGDIHGDLAAWHRALAVAGLVDASHNWVGGKAICVQIGDLIDGHGAEDDLVLQYTVRLQAQAVAAGGELFVILGDHDVNHLRSLWRQSEVPELPSWMRLVLPLHGTLFVHGSLMPKMLNRVSMNINTINNALSEWIAGRMAAPSWLHSDFSPLESRRYGEDSAAALNQQQSGKCAELQGLLQGLSLKRMVIGHTVRNEGISPACDNQIWRIDVGLAKSESDAGKVGATQVLEITFADDQSPATVGGQIHRQVSVRVLHSAVTMPNWSS